MNYKLFYIYIYIYVYIPAAFSDCFIFLHSLFLTSIPTTRTHREDPSTKNIEEKKRKTKGSNFAETKPPLSWAEPRWYLAELGRIMPKLGTGTRQTRGGCARRIHEADLLSTWPNKYQWSRGMRSWIFMVAPAYTYIAQVHVGVLSVNTWWRAPLFWKNFVETFRVYL